MKKVLFITYYWPPSGGAGVQRSLKFVKYLPEYGVEPVVITVNEEVATYPLVDETLRKEVDSKIRVIRTGSFEPLKVLSAVAGKKSVPYGGFANKGKESLVKKALRFIRGNFFIPDARIGWVKHAVKAASEIIEKENIKTVFISSPPHSSQLIGLELKKKYSVRWIADMRDPWTDIYYYKEFMHTKSSAEKDRKLELQVLESSDALICVSESIKRMFAAKSDRVGLSKISVIPNGFDESDFSRVQTESKQFTFTYVGTMADNYKPEVLFKAIKRISELLPERSVRLKLVGSYGPEVQLLVEKTGLSGVTEFVSHVDHARAVQFMQEASALLLAIPDVPGNEGILTGKLFEYIGSGRPIVGVGPVHGDASEILKKSRAGVMFDRVNAEEIFQYMLSLVREGDSLNAKAEGREYINTFSRRVLTGELAKLIS